MRFEAAKHHLLAKGRRHDKVFLPESGLKQRFSTVARHYEITVEKAGANATAVRFSHRPQYDKAGDNASVCVLRTSDRDIETVLGTWITDIEATFRALKSELGLRPIWLDQCIAAHLLIAVLAAVHLIPARGIHKCRTSIRESMRNQGHHAPAPGQIDRQPTRHAPPGLPKSPRRLMSNPPHEEPPHKLTEFNGM